MKKNDTANKLILILICAHVCLCLSACGNEGTVEETVEITTPAEETAPADTGKSGDADAKKDADPQETGKSDAKAKSPYEQIYNDYKAEMEEATETYVGELKEKSGSLSKNDLYDETQKRIKALEKIYDEGKDKMVDTMLKSTEDDAKAYKKYFEKLTETYTELTREITATYTDNF